jgi:hypothetical protein
VVSVILRYSVRLILALGVLACVDALAHSFREPSAAEKMSEADLVVVGEVLAVSAPNDNDARNINVRRHVVLKGGVADEFAFEHGQWIAEMSSDCCSVGVIYIFFLRGNYRVGWAPLRGQEAIMRLDQPYDQKETIPAYLPGR